MATSPTITTEELLAELERVEASNADGETFEEIQDRLDVGTNRLRILLRRLGKEGRLLVSHKPARSICGHKYWANCYRVLPAKKPAKTKAKKR